MTTRPHAFRQYQRSMAPFSRDVVGVPLYPYQVEWADYALQVVAERRNETVCVEMPRQSGKNETSAQLETALLARSGRAGGDIVKCAPTFKPQIVNSKARFAARSTQALQRLPFLKFKPSMGYIYQCGLASIQFLSAEKNASVVGATASLLLEVDEAQDVDRTVFNKNFSPMRASTGAPVVAYGTTWTDDTLLEEFKRSVEEGRTPGKVFRVLPEIVADANPAYGDFVDAEVKRLGRDHPLIRTQYFLEALPQAGRMLKPDQLRSLAGEHKRQEKRAGEAQIVAGLDFAGADEVAGELVSLGTGGRDSVALTIAAVEWATVAEGLIVPHARILDRYEWTNVNPVTLHSALYDILQNRWRVDRVHCDDTGVGAASTAFLAGALNKHSERVIGVTFDGAWNAHTRLAFQYIAAVLGMRLKDYTPGFDPVEVATTEAPDRDDVTRHAWWQRAHAKLDGRPGQRVKAYVPENEGHDDLLLSELLMMDAAYNAGRPQMITTGQVDFYGNPNQQRLDLFSL